MESDLTEDLEVVKSIMKPKVSFVVPCYKLGHLLAECVRSILAQTYKEFEVLIMDDCSPDQTLEVARSLRDPRVKYIRNERNLGHLANYNKGIGLAKGNYIWLISADDSLRSPRVLERYVQLMEDNPRVGYVFCPAIRIVQEQERGVMTFSEVAPRDSVIDGHRFLIDHLLHMNMVPAPAAMARKKCYESISLFPLDLPHTGDWYLWGMFALYFDVGFFAEPMVNRRFHDQNMSSVFYKEATVALFANNLSVPLRIRERAKKEGFDPVVKGCKQALAEEYLHQATPPKPGDVVQAALGDTEFEDSLRSHVPDPNEQVAIRAHVYAGLADYYYEQGNFTRGLHYYRRALLQDWRMPKVWAKYLLLRMGSAGTVLREVLSAVKRQVRRNLSAKL
jgi:glycosyltransferase involved in cell wall biosynthesis